ncbi:MAG: PadR family transcriptional regulator [Jatrophihabitantaceae bacterium]
MLNTFADQARRAIVVGNRIICLVQSNDPKLTFEPVGTMPVMWNDAEWLDSKRGLWPAGRGVRAGRGPRRVEPVGGLVADEYVGSTHARLGEHQADGCIGARTRWYSTGHLDTLCLDFIGMATAHVTRSLDLLLMGVLRHGPAHGYAIITALRERSDGQFDLAEGSIYPALHRLEKAGVVASTIQIAQGRRRRVYALTARGREEFATQRHEWQGFVAHMQEVLA